MTKFLPTGVPDDPTKYWHLIGHPVVVSTPGEVRHVGILIAVGADRIVLGGQHPNVPGDVGTCDRIATTRIYRPEEHEALAAADQARES